ncbi:MAG: sensor domain-containing diguanylate cyclase [Lachnospiraceae bacterium]|nr:sensor domain-containing diguanylate cyclase [Lachnospiraceae bacterium]
MAEHKMLSAEEMLAQIFEYMNQLMQEQDFSSTIMILTELGRTLVNADRASFWMWDRRNHQHYTIVALDNGKIIVPEGKGIVGASILKNETILINDASQDYRFASEVDENTGYVTRSILCMPVTDSSGSVIGAYQAINKIDETGDFGAFSEEDKTRLALAAVYCGKMLESYMLSNENYMDSVTGLRSRKGFYEYYNKRILPFLFQDNVSVVMADIDMFSLTNRIHGKSIGDLVLRECADLILYQLQNLNDEVVRWEEDCFLIILPKCNMSEAAEFAEKLRSAVENAEFQYGDYKIRITISCGVGEMKFENSSDDNIAPAMSKLTRAKQLGRNRVEY